MGSDSAVLRIRRIDSRKEDILRGHGRAAAETQSAGRHGQPGRPATDDRDLRPAVEPGRSGRANLPRRGPSGAWRPCSTIPPASTRRSFPPPRSACPRTSWPEPTPRPRPQFLAAIRRVRENIRVFQEAILHRDVRVERPGGYLVERYRPLDRVGICVPGGAAAYPSTVLMTAVPAQVAGVRAACRGRPADQVRRLQSRPAGHLP